MHFWNTKALGKELREGTVTQKDKMKYFLILLIIFGIPFSSYVAPKFDYTFVRFPGLILSIIINIWGVIFCYQANQKGDDKDFIDRFVCLSLPISIKLLLLLFLSLSIGFIITVSPGYEPELHDRRAAAVLVLIRLALQITYFLWVWAYISEVSGADQPATEHKS